MLLTATIRVSVLMFNKFSLFVVICGLGLVACQTTSPKTGEPFRLNVAKVEETVIDFKGPVDHQFQITPERALKNWARDRVIATGAKGTAHFVIKNAAATTSKLNKELSERHTVYIEAELQVMDEEGNVRALASALAKRTRTITEDASLNQREKLWHDITRAAMADFNGAMERAIMAHFKGWLN
jgi:hypothetical protein